MRRFNRILSCVLLLIGVFLAGVAFAVDAPHNATNSMDCISCHLSHHTVGITRSNAAGNVNLCHSCHTPGGLASRYALVESDQAIAGPSLPTNIVASGTSHRWDSGLAGHAEYIGGALTNSCGLILPSGDYTGRVAKTYVITITTNGQATSAKFNWYGTQPGGGGAANLTASNSVYLDQGISIIFSNGNVSPSFRAGDIWNLYVRTDISQPTNTLLLGHVSGALLACSTCHDQHSETNTPFDINAPTNAGAIGRHFQRINNNACQLCTDCHAARNVTNAASGSHPVGVTVPTNGFFKPPSALLPLERNTKKVRCLTCHDIHNSATTDGNLLRNANRTALCVDCHTLADTNQAAHLSLSAGVLWPGGQYGTTYPQETDTAQRGMCNNCHQPHGWTTNLNSSVDYTNLLVEAEEKLCFTCHDGSPAASTNSVINDFTNSTKVVRHPVVNSDSQRHTGRSVECTDCHNPHKARVGRSVYSTSVTNTFARNLVVNPNIGASGVAVNYTGLGNFGVPGTNNYTFTNSVVYEYQICFKCHSSYLWGTNAPTGLSANGSVTNPVETDLAQEFNTNNLSGHPIVSGLNNYPNSGSPKSLSTTAMKAPWNINVGTQTMLCTDCHNTDGNLAQGPHGSAAQFMLRRVFTNGVATTATNWPNVSVSSFTSSWCANCHNKGSGEGHKSQHNNFLCYECHIVVPHGGKISRLMADSSGGMPSRYAFNNNIANVSLTAFTKEAEGSYVDTDCGAACIGGNSGPHSSTDGVETW